MAEPLPTELPKELVEEMKQIEAQVTLGGLMDLLVSQPDELRRFLEDQDKAWGFE